MKVGKKFNKNDIGLIVKSKEKHISFSIKISVYLAGVIHKDRKEIRKNIQLKFIDSCRFMASSIAKLSSNLDDNQYKNLREFYTRDKVFWLMWCKCVYS